MTGKFWHYNKILQTAFAIQEVLDKNVCIGESITGTDIIFPLFIAEIMVRRKNILDVVWIFQLSL